MTVTDFPPPQPKRKRLPNRRMAVSETIEFVRSDGGLFGAKAGSDMALALADTAVALSVALQHGVTAQAMALSVSRNPEGVPVSVIGAALDLLARLEREREAA